MLGVLYGGLPAAAGRIGQKPGSGIKTQSGYRAVIGRAADMILNILINGKESGSLLKSRST